jgi:hypothetical protein
MSLQESNNRIDQVCEEDRKSKDQNDASRNVKNYENKSKEKDGEEDVRGSPIRECHVFTRGWPIDASACELLSTRDFMRRIERFQAFSCGSGE